MLKTGPFPAVLEHENINSHSGTQTRALRLITRSIRCLFHYATEAFLSCPTFLFFFLLFLLICRLFAHLRQHVRLRNDQIPAICMYILMSSHAHANVQDTFKYVGVWHSFQMSDDDNCACSCSVEFLSPCSDVFQLVYMQIVKALNVYVHRLGIFLQRRAFNRFTNITKYKAESLK